MPAKQVDEFMPLIYLHQFSLQQLYRNLLQCTEQNVIKVSHKPHNFMFLFPFVLCYLWWRSTRDNVTHRRYQKTAKQLMWEPNTIQTLTCILSFLVNNTQILNLIGRFHCVYGERDYCACGMLGIILLSGKHLLELSVRWR